MGKNLRQTFKKGYLGFITKKSLKSQLANSFYKKSLRYNIAIKILFQAKSQFYITKINQISFFFSFKLLQLNISCKISV